MKINISLIFFVMAVFSHSGHLLGQEKRIDLQGQYLGQGIAKQKAEIFAPGMISTEKDYEFGSVFSKEGDEFYYGVDLRGKSEIRFVTRRNGKWSAPQKIDFGGEYSYNDPFLSPDGNRLYFISNRALDGLGDKKDYDIWYAKREGDGWSEPVNAGDMINSDKDEYYMSFSKEGTIYFASNVATTDSTRRNFDIYCSKLENGVYQEPVRLGDGVNTADYEADVFVDPDEQYLIFCSFRKGGYGAGDLYISFKKDGVWTAAQNMGPKINTKSHELCPFVTADGKCFFYASDKDIYWIDASVLSQFW